ncbi:MAG: BolA family transcriptional regulator [Deltaproteobacteria bacterium]|nr:BolA family transcriptional regulator [Deltaproteobacteria bacterium]
MSIEIPGPGGVGDVTEEIRGSILEAIPDAEVKVTPGGPGHFEIRVVAPIFTDKSRVKQQQLVYAAITHLMSGPNPPVHAVDRLDCSTP